MRGPRIAFGLVVLASGALASLSLSSATAAQASHGGESTEVASARQHFKAGEKAFNAGDYPRALVEFEAGYVLVPRPGFLLNMAHTERRLGHTARARELYQRFLESDPQSKQRDEVLGLIADLDRTLYAGGRGEASAPAVQSAGAGTNQGPEPAAAEPTPLVAQPDDEEPAAAEAPPSAAPLPRAPPPIDEPAALVSTRRSHDQSDEPTDDHQPVYKRWWFWATMGVVAVGATTGIILATRPAGLTFQSGGSLGRVGSP